MDEQTLAKMRELVERMEEAILQDARSKEKAAKDRVAAQEKEIARLIGIDADIDHIKKEWRHLLKLRREVEYAQSYYDGVMVGVQDVQYYLDPDHKEELEKVCC